MTEYKPYLISLMQPDGPPPEQEVLDEVMARLGQIQAEITDAGGWVMTAALHPADVATVVRSGANGVDLTDGPYVESKEHVGGFWVVRAPDLDTALGWAEKISTATTLPTEVRPIAAISDL